MAAYPEIEIGTHPHALDLSTGFRADHGCSEPEPQAADRAIFGLSDSTALAGQHAAKSLGLIDDQTVVVGINGDPMALAGHHGRRYGGHCGRWRGGKIGGRQWIWLWGSFYGQPLPRHFGYRPRLVPLKNITRSAPKS